MNVVVIENREKQIENALLKSEVEEAIKSLRRGNQQKWTHCLQN